MPEEMKSDRFMTDPPQGEDCSERVGSNLCKDVLEEMLGKAPPKGSLSSLSLGKGNLFSSSAMSNERLLRESLYKYKKFSFGQCYNCFRGNLPRSP